MASYEFNMPGKERYKIEGDYTPEQAHQELMKNYVKPGQRHPQGMAAMAPAARDTAVRMHAQFQRRQTGQPGPTDLPNSFLAGAGGAMTNVWNAGVQGLGHAANFAGIKSDADLAEMDRVALENKELGRIGSQNNPGMGAGSFAAENLIMAPLGTVAAPAKSITQFLPKTSIAKEVPEWLGKARNKTSRFAAERPIATGAGIGGTVSAMEVSENPDNYWGDKTLDVIRGLVMGGSAGKLQEYAQKKFGFNRDIDNAEKVMETKVLGGSGQGNRESGEAALGSLQKLKDMNKKQVTKAYEGAKDAYKYGAETTPDGSPIQNDIDMSGYLSRIKHFLKTKSGPTSAELQATIKQVKGHIMEYNRPVIEKITKRLQKSQTQIKQQVKNKTLTADEGRQAMLENTRMAREEIDNLPQNIDVDQLDDIDKNITAAWKAGKQKEFIDKDPRYVNNATSMKDALGETLKGQRAEGVFSVGKEMFHSLKKGSSITIAGQEKPLLNWMRKAKPEEMFKKLFREGSEENIEQAKEIFLKRGPDGEKAWNGLRSRMFADIYGEANNWYKGSKIINPDDFQHQLDRVGKEKLDTMFSKQEQEIMQKLATVDDRAIFEMIHSMFKGPRLTYSGRFFREGANILLRMTFQSKEKAGFAQSVAKATGRGKIPGWRANLEGTLKSLWRPVPGNTALASSDERRADHTMQLIKSMGRSAANATREAIGAK